MRSHANIIAEVLNQHASRLVKEEAALTKNHASSKLLPSIQILKTELGIVSLWLTLDKGTEDVEKRIKKIQQECSTLVNSSEADTFFLSDVDFTYKKLAESILSLIGQYQKEKSSLFKKETEMDNAEKLARFQADATAFMSAQRQERYINSNSDKTPGAGALGVFSKQPPQSPENKKFNSLTDTQSSKKER